MSKFAPNGSSYITAPTLGNLLSSVVRVVSQNVTWASGAGYIWSQAANSSREWGLAQSGGDVQFIAGGTNNVLGAFATLFPSGLSDVELEIEVNMNTGAWSLSVDGSEIASGTLNVGGVRIDGCLFRIGGRGSTNTSGDTSSTFLLGAADNVGDTQVYIDGVLTRNYVMPFGTATTIPDNENNQDATLHNGTGDGSDWEETPSPIVAPVINYPIYAIGSNGLSKYVFDGTYSGITPTSVQFRVMQGANEIQTWTNVDSFGSGLYSFNPAIAWGVGYTLEVRATENGSDYETAISDSFDVGPIIGCVGDSSCENAFTDSSAITSGRVHVESGGGWSTTDTALMTGESAVSLANYIYTNFGNNCPVGLYDAGVGGTLLSTGWQPGGINYNSFLAMVDESNISAIIISAGYNDAHAEVFTSAVDAQNYLETTFSGFRSEFDSNLPIILLSTQRDDRTTQQDQQYVWNWQAEAAVRDAQSNTYWVVRMDLDISGDTIHLTQADANISFERAGLCLDYIFDDSTYYRGPQITSVTISETTVTVNLGGANTNFSSIDPTSLIEGFRILDDGVPVTINSVTSSGTTITIELASAPSGTATLDFAGYNANPWTDADANNYPKGDDALSLPVEPIFSEMSINEAINVIGSGGFKIYGSAIVSKVKNVPPSETGLVISGESLISKSKNIISSSGIKISGDSIFSKSKNIFCNAGFIISGTALVSSDVAPSIVGSGGIVIGGSAIVSKSKNIIADGGIKITGFAVIDTVNGETTISGTYPEDFVTLASELLGYQFAAFRKPATFSEEIGFDYSNQTPQTRSQTVQMIRLEFKERQFDNKLIKAGDYVLIGEYQHFQWDPKVDSTTVLHDGIHCNIKGSKIDPASATIKLHVRRL